MSAKVSYILKGIVFFKGVHYANPPAKNVMTDAQAKAFLKVNPAHERFFLQYPEGYKVESDEAKVADAKKKLAKSKQDLNKGQKDLIKAEKEMKAKAEEVESLANDLEEAKVAIEKADDDQKEAMTQKAKEVDEAHIKALEELETANGKVESIQDKVEEGEADVLKYEALLKKRDK